MENLFSTIVTSALVATVAGAAITAWLERGRTKHTTRFDALSAAVALEGYAIQCADRLSDHELAVSSGGHAGAPIGNVPELPELSVVAGFLRPKKASIANRIMVFPQEIRQADQYVAFMWDVTADIEEVRDAAVSKAASMGLQALLLAEDIRSAFKLPARELEFGKFDVRAVLERSLHEA